MAFASLLSGAAAIVAAQCLLVAADPDTILVDLVGTGGPELTADRAGASTLIRIDGEAFLFDAGRGALQGIYRSGAPPQSVTRIFLTHLHNDHIEGLPTLWITPWFLLNRREHLEIWGPPRTQAMVEGMRGMFAHDVEQRSNERFHRENLDITVHEIKVGVVYEGGSVRIIAIPAEHHEGNPAFAYRFEARGKSVLLTGDTTLTDSLRQAAAGATVIISNVAAGTMELERSGKIDAVLNKLMRPEQAAELFSLAKPSLAVYSHVVKKQLPGRGGDAAIRRRTRQAGYTGPLVMGTDGLRIRVGETTKVMPAPPVSQLTELDGAGQIF
jgi:ribonuclease Z